MLVIIDLQEYYIKELKEQEQKSDRMISNILSRIGLAQKNKEPVINLTNAYEGLTLPEIVEVLQDRKDTHFLQKRKFDGSETLHQLIKRKKLDAKEIELCGIFCDVCLLETWEGLRDKGYNVKPIDERMTIKTKNKWKVTYPNGYLNKGTENDLETKYS